MRRDQFEKAVGLYGGDLAKWPATMRAEAEALAAGDRLAAGMLAAARRLDHLLAEVVRPAPVDAAMMGRIIAGIGNGSHSDVTIRPTGRLAAWAGAAMAAFLVVGFAVGVALPANQGEDALAGLMFGSSANAISDTVEGVL